MKYALVNNYYPVIFKLITHLLLEGSKITLRQEFDGKGTAFFKTCKLIKAK